MKKAAFPLALLSFTLLLAAPSRAGNLAPPSIDGEPLPAASLFFDKEALNEIEKEVEKNPHLGARNRDDLVTLEAILYYGPDRWSLWINGEKWTPDSDKPALHILAVTPTEVELRATPLLGGPAETITLHPRESYDLVTGEVR